jgi:hypothetical protein
MKTDADAKRPESAAGKKPYSKPEVRHEKMFETGALACNPSNAKAIRNPSNPSGCAQIAS